MLAGTQWLPPRRRYPQDDGGRRAQAEAPTRTSSASYMKPAPGEAAIGKSRNRTLTHPIRLSARFLAASFLSFPFGRLSPSLLCFFATERVTDRTPLAIPRRAVHVSASFFSCVCVCACVHASVRKMDGHSCERHPPRRPALTRKPFSAQVFLAAPGLRQLDSANTHTRTHAKFKAVFVLRVKPLRISHTSAFLMPELASASPRSHDPQTCQFPPASQLHADVSVDAAGWACWAAELHHSKGPSWAPWPGASPEGTARLEEPLAGQQLNKRWEGSVSLEGHLRWEAPRLNAEDKQMLDETGKTEENLS